MMLSTGIAMEVHYCMGQKVGVDFFHEQDEKCGGCGMKEKDKGCCHDEIKFYKYSESFSTQKAHDQKPSFIVNIHAPKALISKVAGERFQHKEKFSKPIYDYGPPLRVLYCIYRL